MTVATPIADMTSEAIRARIGQIEREERAHAARDLDAELAQVVLRGGDAEAIEEAHLQAERAARRLRAERIALQTALPDTLQAEGRISLDKIVRLHSDTARDAAAAVVEVETAFQAFRAAARKLNQHQEEAAALTEKAASVARTTGTPLPDLGNFRSARIAAIAEELFGIAGHTSDMWPANLRFSGSRGVHIGNRSYQQVID